MCTKIRHTIKYGIVAVNRIAHDIHVVPRQTPKYTSSHAVARASTICCSGNVIDKCV